jgi:hypothetical protein
MVPTLNSGIVNKGQPRGNASMSMATLASSYSMRSRSLSEQAGQRPNPVDACRSVITCRPSFLSTTLIRVDDGALLGGTRCQRNCRGVL